MSSSPRKLVFLFDWPLLGILALLLFFGLVNLYSASASRTGELSPFFLLQLGYVALGLLIFTLCLLFHYRSIFSLTVPFYVMTSLLLLAVVFFGVAAGGQKNWLSLGPVRLQPSELAKFSLVLILSRYFSRRVLGHESEVKKFFLPALYIALPTTLTLAAGDLGAAIFFVLIGITLFFLAGMKKRWFILGLLLLGAMGAAAYTWGLKDYQRARVETFLHPEKDPQGRGYHLVQSKIAVGSGRWLGRGYLEGRLNKLKFLPERHTDFVFPVLAEEWGFVGSLTVWVSFLLFFLLLLKDARRVEDPMGAFVIAGVGAWLFWQVLLNLGGVLGLMPLAGVTLPFFSYGGSALVANLAALGLAFNIYMRRYVF